MKNIIKILAVLLMTATAFAVYAYAAEIPFDDVAADAWYYDTVVEAYETGVMKGQSDTKFAPMVTMSRSEFVMLLYRITGVTETGFAKELEKFDDGDTDEWYSEAMGWGVARGLIKGMDDNTVRPAQTITRAELAVMIVRYLSYRGITLPDAADEVTFTDDAKIADWAREQIYTCQIWGIFKGDDAGNFNPANKATRAEGATIILRLTKSADDAVKQIGFTVATRDSRSPYTIFYQFIGGNNTEELKVVRERMGTELGYTFAEKPYVASNLAASTSRIVFNVPTDPVIAEMTEGLSDSGYAMKLVRDGEYNTLYFAYTSVFARTYAVEYLLTKYVKDGSLAVPENFSIVGDVTAEDFMHIDGSITKNCRDPFILAENGTYYLYVTGWRVYKSTSLTGEWTEIKNAVEKPADYSSNRWAPEVHKYNGKYYMFTTYTPKDDMNDYDNHGCIIMEASSPEGPFKMITDGWITPKEWDCIDGTLYVDPDGQPWMVFVHEHTSFADDNGAFCAAKLSEDFTRFTSEPIELFRAKDPEWAQAGVTDGCFMYTTAEGELLMLWSNYDPGYCVAIARSSNGGLDGEWLHDTDSKLYSTLTVGIGGGHGMLFEDFDGQMYLCFHSPDTPAEGENSKVTILPVIERNGTLVWDVTLN